jgi:hypothetical protein
MQAKDIPEAPIVQFLSELAEGKHGDMHWGCDFAGYPNSVQNVMPPDTPEKVARAKMRAMIKKGIVSGCACGCRGDYRLE